MPRRSVWAVELETALAKKWLASSLNCGCADGLNKSATFTTSSKQLRAHGFLLGDWAIVDHCNHNAC